MTAWLGRLTFRRTSLIGISCASFLVGLGLARWQAAPVWWPLLLSLIMVMIRRRNLVMLLVIALMGLSIGLWRGGQVMKQLAVYQPLWGRNVVLTGHATADAVYDRNGQLAVDLGSLRLVKPVDQPLVGRIGVAGWGETAIDRGDQVQVKGRLYPARGSRQAKISYAELSILRHHDSIIEKWRRRFVASMLTALPEPQASFGLGLLIGQRNTLPSTTADQLAAAGLTHLIAVSGYNLTIIIRAVRQLLGRGSKYQTLAVSVALIMGFLLITGFSASIVRAGLVSFLSLLGWYYGRTFKPLVLILLVAAATAAWSPLYLWSDIGWYLSFLAFYGVLVLAPIWQTKLRWRGTISQILCETVAAQLMTLPLIMFIFGHFSIIAVLANLLVVPIVPMVMMLSLVAGLGSLWLGVWTGWLAWPAQMSLTYMLDISAVLAGLPNIVLRQTLTVAEVTIAYSLISLWSWLWLRTKRPGTITE